ncbi:uncharacterized protein LOC143216259 [Lasioglossum baleicum]|uniref:uncharacterized protein LOC143216259 n=1 Tax=Lasioglossum baleicum TaxID=434251 RepID=UPI003FCC785D
MSLLPDFEEKPLAEKNILDLLKKMEVMVMETPPSASVSSCIEPVLSSQLLPPPSSSTPPSSTMLPAPPPASSSDNNGIMEVDERTVEVPVALVQRLLRALEVPKKKRGTNAGSSRERRRRDATR